MHRIEIDVETGEQKIVEFTAEEIAALPPPPPPPVPSQITRRQCAKQLLAMGLITAPEALAMTKTGDAPALVLDLFNALPEAFRIDAQIDFAADTYERSNPLLNRIMTAMGKTDADCDQFFRDAAVK